MLFFYSVLIGWNLDYFILSLFNGWGSSPDFFFNNVFLQSTTSLSGIFQIVLFILIGIITIWVIIWIILSRNINDGIGKFCRVFVPLFLILCVVLVIYELTLPGAYIGYMRVFSPNWSILGDLNIWLVAFSQVIFTLSLGYTLNMTYGSHLADEEDLPITTLSIIIANCGFEIVNAIGIFSILGFMSYSSGIPFDFLITQGTGLVFVALPTIFNILGPIGRVIGPIFFFSIVLIEISTIIGVLEPLIDSLSVEFDRTRKKLLVLLLLLVLLFLFYLHQD
ncbi:MAG: hypothetical protein MJ209_04500 [archaeon]|nr:hypothetical protein [archaeon]